MFNPKENRRTAPLLVGPQQRHHFRINEPQRRLLGRRIRTDREPAFRIQRDHVPGGVTVNHVSRRGGGVVHTAEGPMNAVRRPSESHHGDVALAKDGARDVAGGLAAGRNSDTRGEIGGGRLNDVSDSYRYQTISRVRKRFERLDGDLDALEAHGDLLDELREVVCDGDE